MTLTPKLQTLPRHSTDLSLGADHPALPAAIYLSRLTTKASRRGMTSSLNSVAELHAGRRDWTAVSWVRILQAGVVEMTLASLAGSAATKNKALSALKGVAKAAFQLDRLSAESLAKIREVSAQRSSRKITGRDIEKWELKALLDICRQDTSPAGARDTALFALASITGARRSEIASLRISDLSWDAGDMVVADVIGKGDRERTLYIHGTAKDELEKWLALRGEEPGGVFCRIDKSGRIFPGEPVSDGSLARVLKKRLAPGRSCEVHFPRLSKDCGRGALRRRSRCCRNRRPHVSLEY